MAKKVLVTGGCGFVGSHVVEELLNHDYDVTVVDNLTTGDIKWLDGRAKFMLGDIQDEAAMDELCVGMDGVFHLAAMSRVLPSITGGPYANTFGANQNIIGTLNVLNAAVKHKVKKVIYSGSSTVYGNLAPPHRESLPPSPETPYALSKYVGEGYTRLYQKMYGIETAVLRYFQVYGPRQPTIGSYAMVAGIFMEQARTGKPLTIHGDGEQSRDFVHVKDVAEANRRAFESPHSGFTVNIGRGEAFSINQLADMFPNSERQHLPKRPHDMRTTRADRTDCQTWLGWLPERQFIPEMRKMIDIDSMESKAG